MKDRRLHLKIKIKTLTAEADIIRFEAHKVCKFEKWELNHHRTTVVRDAARRNLLAYAMLRNKPYKAMELKTEKPIEYYIFEQILGIAKRFGCTDKEMMQQWMDDAVAHLKSQGYKTIKCPDILTPPEKPDTKIRRPIFARVSEAFREKTA